MTLVVPGCLAVPSFRFVVLELDSPPGPLGASSSLYSHFITYRPIAPLSNSLWWSFICASRSCCASWHKCSACNESTMQWKEVGCNGCHGAQCLCYECGSASILFPAGPVAIEHCGQTALHRMPAGAFTAHDPLELSAALPRGILGGTACCACRCAAMVGASCARL